MKVQVITWLISDQHAARMMKKLNMKRHAHLGFYFEYEEVGNLRKYLRQGGWPPGSLAKATAWDERVIGVGIYADYPSATEGGLLTVYREAPEPLVWLQRGALPASFMAEARDARRELGKWLNEQPNREVDKTAIATLIAVFDALAG